MFQLTNRFNFNHLTIKCQIVVFLLFFSPFIVFSQKVNIDSLKQILETEIDTETRVEVLSQIIMAYTYIEPKKAKSYIEEGLQLTKGNRSLEIKILDGLANNLEMSNQLDSAMSIAQNILPDFIQMGNKKKISMCYRMMGAIMIRKEGFEASIDFFKKGLEVLDEEDVNKAILYYELSNAYASLGKQKETLENTFKALKIAEKVNYHTLLAGIKSNIGYLYYQQGDNQTALEYQKEVLKLLDKDGLDISIASAKFFLAGIYVTMGQTEVGLKIYQEILAFGEQINYAPYIFMAKTNIAYIYSSYNDSIPCKPLLAELDTLVDQMDFPTKIEYYKAKVLCHQNHEEYESAIKNANIFQEFAISINDNRSRRNAVKYLSNLHYKVGDFKLAYEYQNEFITLNDSLVNQQRKTELTLRDAQYHFENEQLALEKTHQTEASAQKRVNIWATAFAIILGIISFLLFRVAQSRKKISAELLEKNEELVMLDESKTRFFANVSHELKTPLTLIINPLQKLKKQEKLSEDGLYLVKTAEKNSLGLFDLTNQILELTKFEVDKIDINYSNLNFYYLLKKTFANFESLAKSRGIDFQLDYQGDENLVIQMDEYKLQTILKNLISNALKFTVPDDFVKVSAIEKEHTLEIQIQDSGRGIHSEDLPHVFDRYFQSKMPKTVSEGGTGIGLAICKEYSKLLGGGISVASKYGESTIFSISLPKIITENPITVPNTIVSTTLAEHFSSIPNKTNNGLPTLLLVEDNLEMQAYIQFTLQTHYNIITAKNGYEGIKKLEAHSMDIQLIISDIMMPVMDGYEFLETIKKDEKFAAIPIIMLTALSDTKHKLKSLRMGIDDYLTKPFADEELIVRIDNLLVNANEKQAFQLMETSVPITSNKEVSTKQVTNQVEEKISIQDLEWLKKLEEIVKDNISDNSYTVDKLAMQMATSRSLIYRKIKAFTGLTPNNYINQARFEQARYYIEAKEFSNIKMIAYQVGFKDEKYFARNFKKRFGKYPSEYL